MKRGYRFLKAAIVVLCLTYGARVLAPARAQGVFDMGALTNTLSQGAVQRSEARRAHARSPLRGALSHPARAAKATHQPAGTLRTLGTFTPSQTVRQRSIADFLAGLRRIEPQTADLVAKDFARKDVFGVLAQRLSRYGLKTNNVADAMAVYLVVAWQGVRGSNQEPDRRQVRAVREQMARALANVPALSRASNAQKQALAEGFLLRALLVDSYVSGAKIQPALMPGVKMTIANGVRTSFNLDLTALRLTNQGLQ